MVHRVSGVGHAEGLAMGYDLCESGFSRSRGLGWDVVLVVLCILAYEH